MELVWQLIGVALALGLVWGVMNTYDRWQRRRIQNQIEQEQFQRDHAEAERIAALPKLDTSHMLSLGLCEEEIAECRPAGGTFGNRYVHMLVTDRDGRRYFCFMTPHNMRALWISQFHQVGYTPHLTESDDDFVINGVTIGVHPTWLRRFSKSSETWRRWAELHREFDEFGGNHFAVFKMYFNNGRPRENPLNEEVVI